MAMQMITMRPRVQTCATMAVQLLAAVALSGCSFFNWLFGVSEPDETSRPQAQIEMQPQAETLEEKLARPRRELPVALAQRGLALGDPVYIRIYKDVKEMEIWMLSQSSGRWTLFRNYPICRYSGKLGPKLKQGDKQAPEGFYKVYKQQLNPASSYHLSFNLGYPNEFDRANKRTGDFLMVHGGCGSSGCYAMTNPVIEDIYLLTASALEAGQTYVPVHAFPAKLSDVWMASHRTSQWARFWRDMKQCDRRFTSRGIPANPTVEDGRYRCSPVAGSQEPMVYEAQSTELPADLAPPSELAFEPRATKPRTLDPTLERIGPAERPLDRILPFQPPLERTQMAEVPLDQFVPIGRSLQQTQSAEPPLDRIFPIELPIE
jgi:murein L,D-transpeptidase YafK